jgi:hypothetical protein
MTRTMEYGDKRDYSKIDLYVDHTYVCSTTWSRTCKEAVQHYTDPAKGKMLGKVTAHKAN